jgi:beta-galactosidase
MRFHAIVASLALTSLALVSLTACAAQPAAPAKPKHTFAIGTNDFLLDGQRFQIRCGEVHAPRVPKEYWRHRLQMAKAMGLNTVCAYLFWNMHEPRPGEFNWSGQADAAEFCRIAQEEGLWVMLRPGPYACAEWEMGGFPWWLLKHDDIKLRTRDPRYLDAAKRYMKEVGRVLGPLQVTQGGPILMVQVENEYGFYGKDAEYMGELRQALLDAGFDVPLFACNPVHALKNGYRKDLFPVVNFGADPANGFKALREILPQGPLMCGEFYPGWFDTWGSPHHLGKTDQYLKDLEYMLKNNASFSIYMAHGGTSFGFTSGADRPFKPDTSSYDYDAPISEAGWTTDKFFKTRELFAKYLLPGETIPEPPAKNPVISIPPVEVKEFADVFKNLPEPVRRPELGTFEQYDQAHGLILYRTFPDRAHISLPPVPKWSRGVLEAKAVGDIAQVFLNFDRAGFLDRRSRNFKLPLATTKELNNPFIDILVDAMGRVNFGVEVHDRKGLQGPVNLTRGTNTTQLTDWYVYLLPLDEKMLAGLHYQSTATNHPSFYRARVNIEAPGDTWLDMRPWGKGYAWVNGHNLGRYWNIGPQQTMYVPGAWLKKGANEIIILDLLGPEKPVIAALDHPILDELHPEKDFARSRRPEVKLNLDSARTTLAASFIAGAAQMEVKLNAPAKGRYFCFESLSAHDGQSYAAIAELDLLDADGKPLSHEGWTVAYVDSEERAKEDGTAENAIDGQTANFWHTEWSDKKPGHPHRLILDLGQSREVGGFRYTPRQGQGGGRIKDYKVYVGDGLVGR